MTAIKLDLQDDYAGDYINGETWSEDGVLLCIRTVAYLWPALARDYAGRGHAPKITMYISDKKPRDGDGEYLKFVPYNSFRDVMYNAFDSNGDQVEDSIYITRRTIGNIIAAFHSAGSAATRMSTFYVWVYRQ